MKLTRITNKEELETSISNLNQNKNASDELISYELSKDIEKRWKDAESVLIDTEKKYNRLVWYARSNKSFLLDNELYETLSLHHQTEKDYPDEVEALKSDDNWSHGFNSGMMAGIRFALGLMSNQFVEEEIDELEWLFEEGLDLWIDENGKIGSICGGKEDALDNFPDLDT
jgi:hypothetical protein